MNPSGANSNQRPLSYDDLLRSLAIVALLALAIAIKETLLLFAISFLITMVLNPGVAWLERRGLNRGVAVVLLVAVSLAILVVVAFLVVPRFIEQLQQLIEQIPGEWDRLYGQILGGLNTYPTLQHALPSRASDLLNTIMSEVGGIACLLAGKTECPTIPIDTSRPSKAAVQNTPKLPPDTSSETVNKTVNNFVKIVDGPSQTSRDARRSFHLGLAGNLANCFFLINLVENVWNNGYLKSSFLPGFQPLAFD